MIQSLERRALLSIAVESGVLTVRGTPRAETIALAWRQVDSSTWNVQISDGKQTQLWGWSGNNSWNSIYIYAGNGADRIEAAFDLDNFSNTNAPPVPIVVNAGAGNDTVLGTANADTIYGGSGYDSILGLDGDDSLFGEGGKDTIRGGNGNDTILGGSGRDKLLGENGNDLLRGEANNDQLDGGIGDDLLIGGGGNDALFAGSIDFGPFYRGPNNDNGFDTLWGSEQNDPNDPGDEIFL